MFTKNTDTWLKRQGCERQLFTKEKEIHSRFHSLIRQLIFHELRITCKCM